MALLALRGASKSFGSRLIRGGLDFDVEPGVRLGVIGPNGGGKSTLLRIIAGEETADAGELTQRRGLVVAYLPQQLEGDERDALHTLRAARPDLDHLEAASSASSRNSASSAATSTAWPARCTARKTWWSAGPLRAARDSTAAPARCSSTSAWTRTISASRRAFCRAAGASSLASRPACFAIPTCCCSTSRRPTSTSRRASEWSA